MRRTPYPPAVSLQNSLTRIALPPPPHTLTLQDACEEDLVSTCSTSVKDMEEDEAKRSSALKCLQQFRDELHSQECRDQVHRKMTRAARDIRFDDVLANACQEDRKQYCNDVQPVSGPVFCYNGFYALIVECLHCGRERCATGNRESEWVSQCGPCMLQSLLCTCRIGQGHAGATAC